MHTNPRQFLLLQEVCVHGLASVEQLGVTLQTVRRDLQRLAEAGLLTRFHGGVRVPSSTVENLAHTQRKTLHAQGKTRIARAVAQQGLPHCSLILNTGTTTEAIAPKRCCSSGACWPGPCPLQRMGVGRNAVNHGSLLHHDLPARP